jgi:pyruvate/2-oxoglutarate dehydrogenase complex dihydrolipoamide dehydrogenase (E3) component
MTDEYDLIVIGAGSGGLSAAPFAAKLGARVALVEKYQPGGDCLYTGCVPSKALIRVARVAWEMRRAADYGLEPHQPRVDLGRVMAHVQDVIQRVYQFENPETLARAGVHLVTGEARFLDAHTVRVGAATLRGEHFLVCTGSRAAVPPIPGLDETGFLTYDELFNLTELPGHLLIVGAGPIGMEMGQAFRRLGSEVTMFQRSKRLLSMADPDCSEALAGLLRGEGVRFHLGATLDRVEKLDGRIVVSAGGERIAGDALLVAAGRRPNVERLDLERAGVAYGPRGIPVDEHLRTNQHHIYACGDVLGEQQFTHYAGMQGYVAVRNALLPGKRVGVLERVPWTIFTDPEVARAGLTEPEARERHGSDVRVTRWPMERIDRAQTEEDVSGFLKVVHKPNGEILGAHIVAARAGEMIHEYIVAMARGLKFGDLSGPLHVYPTYSIGTQQAAAAWKTENLLGSAAGRLISTVARLTR